MLRGCLSLILFWLMACGPASDGDRKATVPVPAADPAADETIPLVAIDPATLAATTRWLAGLDAETAAEAELARHAELVDGLWSDAEARHLGPMRSWAEAELADLPDPGAPLFYPFGGPDIASAVQLFPDASSYVLVGLEPPGEVPRLEDLDPGTLAAELERLRGGLENLVEAGYFVTTKMERDFVGSRFEGLLPPILLLLTRAGHTPEAVRFITLGESGEILEPEMIRRKDATAARIDFSTEVRDGVRHLYYFSQDLSNEGLEGAPGFVGFLHRLGAFNTYLKCASYLLHMDGFTALGDLLTTRGRVILQDDSGVPLRHFTPGAWRLRYYGTYSQTLPSYREWFQEDLRHIYASDEGIRPLSFAIGYNSRIGGGCLIRADREENGL